MEGMQGKMNDLIASKNPTPGTAQNILTHPTISGFVEELKNYAVKFGDFIDDMHIQTVVFDPDPKGADVTISVLSSDATSDAIKAAADAASPNTIKGNVKVIYDTAMKLNGNVRNVYPSNGDATTLDRHIALVNQMWKSKIDTMTKIIDVVTGVLKIGSLL
jgi:hypothetical protein